MRVQDRLRTAGRARCPEHEAHVVAVGARVVEPLEAAGGDQRRRLGGVECSRALVSREAGGSPARTRTPPPTRRTSSSPPSCRSATAPRPRHQVRHRRRRAVGRRHAPRPAPRPPSSSGPVVCSNGTSSANGCSSRSAVSAPAGRSSIDRDSTERNRSEPKGVSFTWVGSRGVPSWWLCCCSPPHARRRHTTRRPPARPRRPQARATRGPPSRRRHPTSSSSRSRSAPHWTWLLGSWAPCPAAPRPCVQLWRSTDAGRHWLRTAYASGGPAGELLGHVVVLNDSHVLVDFDGIVQESFDAGAHFHTTIVRKDARACARRGPRVGALRLSGRRGPTLQLPRSKSRPIARWHVAPRVRSRLATGPRCT